MRSNLSTLPCTDLCTRFFVPTCGHVYSCNLPECVLFCLWCLCTGSAAQRQAVSYTTRKGVKRMRLTITLTLRKLMFQFIIKSRNRHSDK